MSAFRTILIANRGEIACRVIRTCREMGIRSVAVHSEADRDAEHVRLADEALYIGPAEAVSSYLDQDAILDAAARCQADAIHPGYGFLSENAEFAERVEAAGIVFIGPKPASMRAMGSKAGAKALMAAHGVPVIPGYSGDDQDAARLQREADAIGYPLMIKAAHGGGGKGMRIVREAAGFADALASCRREALGAFGKDRVLLEHYIEKPRHIEFQIFADATGHTIHLGERDCSSQRRFQKILEESPSPLLDDDLRARMAGAAVKAAQAVNYLNAGTVEFILAPDGKFYFMEINSRLQVEHPVTEMVTGLDLVRWQIEVACGRPLPLPQADIRPHGHAIEVRLYAEDPERQFLPGSGAIKGLHLPESSGGIRIDAGVREGSKVSVYYDPMLAKLIVHAGDREAALARLQQALARCQLFGLPSNIAFLEKLVAHPVTRDAGIDTGYLDRHLQDILQNDAPLPDWHRLAAAYFSLKLAERTPGGTGDPWSGRDFWRLHGQGWFRARLGHAGDCLSHAIRLADGLLSVRYAQRELAAGVLQADAFTLMLDIDGRHVALHAFHHEDALVVHDGQRRSHWSLRESGGQDAETGSDELLRAPMPGKLVLLKVQAGDRIGKGDELAIMEAMKMELSIKAPGDGTVAELLAEPGRVLDADAPILRWEPSDG